LRVSGRSARIGSSGERMKRGEVCERQ
jgi:hypothetical protein